MGMTLAKSWRALCALALLAPLAAQQIVLPSLRERHASAAVDSMDWFVSGFEVVEAGLQWDLAAALKDAQEVWSSVRPSSPPGTGSAAAALAALACVRLEGPVAAKAWSERVGVMPETASPLVRAYYHLAMARLLCVQGLHAQELRDSIPGQACADQVGSYGLRLRAAITTMKATPQRSLVAFRRLLDEALAGPDAAEIELFRPWLWIEEVQLAFGDGRLDDARRLLGLIETAGRRDGNRLTLAIALSMRASLARRVGDIGDARELMEAALATYTALGDLKDMAGCDDAMARLASDRDEYDLAREFLDRGDGRIRDRGFTLVQDELLKTRFRLAVREHDGDAAAALQDELDRRAGQVAADDKKLAEVRASLAKAEEDRAAAERQLQAEHAEADRHRADTRIVGLLATGCVLAAFAWSSWRARRRLQAANRALATQVREVRRAKREQAALEARMRQLERAESLGTLAAGIAHEIGRAHV